MYCARSISHGISGTIMHTNLTNCRSDRNTTQCIKAIKGFITVY